MFAFQNGNSMAVRFAYLVRIDGQPWAYADLQEIHMRPNDHVKAVPLDPELIVEETSSETGQPVFLYREPIDF